jgi:hypothetical protein
MKTSSVGSRAESWSRRLNFSTDENGQGKEMSSWFAMPMTVWWALKELGADQRS